MWVRSVQSGGGHSAWHLLNSRRKEVRTWREPTPTDPYARVTGEREFALTMCGYDFESFQLAPAAAPRSRRSPGPPIYPAGGGSLCNGCSNFARLVSSTPEVY